MLDPARWLSLAGPVARVATSIVAYFVIPIFVFYLLRDRPALVAAVRGALPEEWRPDIEAVTAIVDRVFARWLRGQLLIGLLVGVAIFIGLEILSVVVDPVFGRFSVLLAVFAGIMELVPIIGPLVAAIPAVLLGATVGLGGILAALVLYFPIQQIETHFIVPKVQGDATDLHPGFVVAGIIIGASIGGILGAILALPLMAAFRDVVRYLLRRLGPEPMGVEPALAEALRPADWRAAPGAAGRAASMTGPVE
jgi:predicted PurR-regulated permease PerM